LAGFDPAATASLFPAPALDLLDERKLCSSGVFFS
jgi:hypothetical protein